MGVIITSNLKVSKQCQNAYNKAIKILGLINTTIQFRNKRILLCLYKSLIRPLLEYCTPAWSPYYIKDKVLLEKAQHRFTRMIPGLKKLDYNCRLETLGIWSLEERRNRADIIEVYKILKGLTTTIPQSLFELSNESRTRGHSLKLAKHRCNSDLRRFFFSERVIERWNKLTQLEIDAKSVNAFKSALDKKRSMETEFFEDK